MKNHYLKNCLKSLLIISILSLPISGGAQTITYNFEGDAVNTTPANVSPKNGTISVDNDAIRTKTMSPQTIQYGNTSAFDMDLFPSAKDYSVTWKETYTTVGRSAFTLRGFGNFSQGGGQQLQGYIFQANALQDAATVYRADVGSTAIIKKVVLLAPGVNTPRWYRATVNGALLTFEYSNDGINFTELISTIEDVFPSAGKTQFTRGYGSAMDGTFVDDVVFTPITTTSVLYDFEADLTNTAPANITAANGAVTTNSDPTFKTNTMNIQRASSGDTAVFDLTSFPSVSNYAVIWKENFSAPGRSAMLLRASGSNSSITGLKQGYLFEASATEGKLRISKSTATGFEMLQEFAVAARGNNLNRWYRAVVTDDKLEFQWSDNGRDFISVINTTDNTYTTGTNQFIAGIGGVALGNSYIDNIVYTPLGNGALAVKQNELKNVTLYPNPARETVNLLFDIKNGETTAITIYDIQGKIVKKIENKLENSNSIDVSSLRKGVYFLKIKSASAEETKKLIVN